MILRRGLIILFFLLFFLVSSCSTQEETEKKGIIEEVTEEIALEAVDRIKSPIDKANVAKELQESHNRGVEQAVESQ